MAELAGNADKSDVRLGSAVYDAEGLSLRG